MKGLVNVVNVARGYFAMSRTWRAKEISKCHCGMWTLNELDEHDELVKFDKFIP
jgi:hypothetical protein